MIIEANELASGFVHQMFRFCSIELPWFFGLTIGHFLLGVLAVNVAVWAYKYENRDNFNYRPADSHMGHLSERPWRRRK